MQVCQAAAPPTWPRPGYHPRRCGHAHGAAGRSHVRPHQPGAGRSAQALCSRHAALAMQPTPHGAAGRAHVHECVADRCERCSSMENCFFVIVGLPILWLDCCPGGVSVTYSVSNVQEAGLMQSHTNLKQGVLEGRAGRLPGRIENCLCQCAVCGSCRASVQSL
eukprot:scaffold194536_cov22-Tisochrysis_lutea.AAC.1